MRITLLVVCSPAPCLRCCHQEGKGRAGRDLWLYHCCTPTERVARRAEWAVTRTAFGFSTVVSPEPFGGTQHLSCLSQGGWLWSSRQGEGRELLSRLTPLTCAACGFARPQDLAH